MKLRSAVVVFIISAVIATALPQQGVHPRRTTPNPVQSTIPNPAEVHIETFRYSGSGCPSNSVTNVISDDLTTMTVGFDQYIVSSGPGVSIKERRKNCQMIIKLRYPHGYQFSLLNAQYRGYVDLQAGSSSTCHTTYFFSGSAKQVCCTAINFDLKLTHHKQGTSQTMFHGPTQKDYLVSDTVGFDSFVYSPCGGDGILNVNNDIRIDPKTHGEEDSMTVDSVDLSLTQKFQIWWRKC
jgi:hypothetical protein